MFRLFRLSAALLLWSAVATAQTTTVTGNRLRLADGPCLIDSVNGSPDKVRLVDCPTITTESATDLTLNPTGDLVLNPVGLDVMPSSGYTTNLGSLQKKYLTLHAAELWVETLVAQNTIATIGGRVLVARTTTLTADIAAAATSIVVKHNSLLSGDRVYMEANGSVEFMAITSSAIGSGPYTYTVTRNLDGSGANDWYAGDAVLDTGTTGSGFIDLYSTQGVISGSGPTIAFNTRTGTAYNAIASRCAIGDLNGLYGYGASTFGMACGDASATNVTADATNGFRIRSGTTDKFAADTSGNLALTGALSVGTNGSFSSGATSFTTGTGWWMDYNGGTPRLRIGTAAGDRLEWNGSSLAVYGDGGNLTNLNGGNIQTGTVSAAKLTVGAGRNLIRNSDCAASTVDWTVLTNAAATFGFTGPSNVSPYRLKDIADNTCYYKPTSGTPALGSYTYAQYVSFPVQAGQVYEASVYLGTQNLTSSHVVLWFLDGAETTTYGNYNGNLCTTASPGGSDLSSWCRSGVVHVAPTGSVRGRILVQANHSGAANPTLYFNRAYFGEGLSSQTELTPWGAAGVTEIVGGQIRTGTITANHLSVSTLSAISANIGTVTAGTINGVTINSVTMNGSSIVGGTININSGAFTVNGSGTVTAPSIGVGSLTTSSSVNFTNGFLMSGGTAVFSALSGGGGGYACLSGVGVLYVGSSCP